MQSKVDVNIDMIIGVVGTLGSGKSSAVDYLVSKGFDYYKPSDVIREKSKLKNPNRYSLQDFGNELRKKFGRDYLVTELWKKIGRSKAKKIVVDGLRNVGEVEFFRKKTSFYLISIDKTRRTRFRRLKIRGSERDPKSWEEFLKMDQRDLDEGKDFGQQTKAVMQMADFSISNDNPIEFYLEIEKILRKINKSKKI